MPEDAGIQPSSEPVFGLRARVRGRLDGVPLVDARPHPKVLIPRAVLGAACVALGCWFGTLGFTSGLLVTILLALALFVPTLADWWCTRFTVTHDRISQRWGVLKRTGLDIALSRIQSIRVERDLNDRLFGCGTLIVESASDEPLVFTDIPHVHDVHALLYEAVEGGLVRDEG